jgi:predicted RNase H-like HicB family nuclease
MLGSKYPIVIEALTNDPGGGFVARVPDLPGCMAEGASREEAARNIGDAITAWIDKTRGLGWRIPNPSHHLLIVSRANFAGVRRLQSRRL